MFCHKCGQSDQSPETYCRKCGTFLRDPDQQLKKRATPDDHIKANSFLSLMTAIVSLILAISLSVVVLGDGSHWLLYLVMGFLFAITAWQVQTFIRMRMLKKQIDRLRPTPPEGEEVRLAPGIARANEKRQLHKAEFSDLVPPSVTEKTTKDLAGRKRSSA
ncbi:hypothetical protein BH20ACI2_BH20ACI2_19930 [soil metagenome]